MRLLTAVMVLLLILIDSANAQSIPTAESFCQDQGHKHGTKEFISCVADAINMVAIPAQQAKTEEDSKKCEEYGYKRGTTEFADCRMKLDMQKKTTADSERKGWQPGPQYTKGLLMMEGVDYQLADMLSKDPEMLKQYRLKKALQADSRIICYTIGNITTCQ